MQAMQLTGNRLRSIGSIELMRILLTVFLTVRFTRSKAKSSAFKYLQVPERIDWE
jgi:hypothetical protein